MKAINPRGLGGQRPPVLPIQNSEEPKKISALEEKLKRKNEVMGELMEEHVQLKKSLGEL